MTTSTRYTLISSDTHAGANHKTYREYLDPKFHEDFDAWREKYKNPWKDLRDTDLRVRNWDNERRDADQHADGVVGEVVFPNTVPPFYPGFVLFAGPPKPEDYEHRRAPVCRRTIAGSSTSARAGRARRHRADLPQRRRRRDRRRDVDQGTRVARRGAPPQRRTRRQVGEAALRPLLRPAVGRVPRHGHPGHAARRHRFTRLRQVRVDPDDHDLRGGVLQPAPVRAHAALRRVRALPADEVRDDRGLGRGVPAAAQAARPDDRQRAQG